MTSDQDTFQYRPLIGTDIRILTLHPSQTKSSPVSCSLLHQPLGHPSSTHPPTPVPPTQEYEALSYTWGTGDPTSSIYLTNKIDNQQPSPPAPFPVTDNLHAALVALRLADRDRHLWIDAICINQDDIPERNRQVLRMLRIYQTARRVVVWLGEEKEEGGRTALGPAMAHLRELGGRWEGRKREGQGWLAGAVRAGLDLVEGVVGMGVLGLVTAAVLFWRNKNMGLAVVLTWHCILTKRLGNEWSAWFAYVPLAGVAIKYTWLILANLQQVYGAVVTAQKATSWVVGKVFRSTSAPSPDDQVLDGLADILSRPWFERVWIVQEASTANKDAIVVCGSHQILWDTLKGACLELHYLTRGWRKSPYERTGYQQPKHVLNALQLDGLAPDDPFIERRLLILLCRFNTQKAHVLHDKVYALLGMSVEIQEQERAGDTGSVNNGAKFETDYNEPLEVAYTRTAKFLIESAGNLRLFRACLGPRSLADLPSWVPDWSSPSWRNLDGMGEPYTLSEDDVRRENSPTRPDVDNSTHNVAKFSDDLKTVKVRGITMGYLTKGPMYSDLPTTTSGRFFVRMYLLAAIPFTWLITSKIAWKVAEFALRVYSTVDKTREDSEDHDETMDLFNINRDAFLIAAARSSSPTETLQIPMNEDSVPGVFHMKGRFSQFGAVIDHILFFGVNFVVSTFAHEPRVGDCICLLEGADIPFLLRKKPGGKTFEMVGPVAFTNAIDRAFWNRFAGSGKKVGEDLREYVLE